MSEATRLIMGGPSARKARQISRETLISEMSTVLNANLQKHPDAEDPAIWGPAMITMEVIIELVRTGTLILVSRRAYAEILRHLHQEPERIVVLEAALRKIAEAWENHPKDDSADTQQAAWSKSWRKVMEWREPV